MEAKSVLISQLILVADAFCGARDRTRSSVSKETFGRGGQIDELEAGRRDLATGTFERAMLWFSANWPEGVEWPAGVTRPAVVAEAAE